MDSEFPKLVECFPQVYDMTTRLLALNYHIIDIYLHISLDLGAEYFIHQPLVCCSCIFKAEGHSDIVVGLNFGNEGSFFLIFDIHSNLVIFAKSIEEAK